MAPVTNPILLDLPGEFESDRLLIRAPRPGDGAAMHPAKRESIHELRPWMPWAQADPDPDEDEQVVRQMAAKWLTREELPMLLWRKADGAFLGGSGLHRIDWGVPRFEIGYWLRTSATGQGYMTEAVRRITRFALDDLGAQRIEIRCDANNIPSAAVAERAGYTLEARFRHHDRSVEGDLRDTLIYVTFPDRWSV